MSQPTVRIIERTRISAPSGSVPRTHLPLTFFDYPWLTSTPQRLFFFDLPRPADHFTLSVVPKLKLSLSAALRHFFPLAAALILPPPPLKPQLLFSPGGAGVEFTAAESAADFNSLASNDPHDVNECRSLVPELLLQAVTPLACEYALPVMAVQVTVFPGAGFSVGLSFRHVAADGRAFNHFVKSWASICGSGLTEDVNPGPCHDRATIVDQYGLEPVFLSTLRALALARPDEPRPAPSLEDKVRATFVVGRAQIEKLKQRVALAGPAFHLSSFVVAVALTWANLVRSRQETEPGSEAETQTHHVCFSADCRDRTGPENPIPIQYFGNCLAICFASVKGSDLIGENGVFHAAREIGKTIKDLEGGVLRNGEMWMKGFIERSESGNMVTVAGSASLGVYRTDFGWGCPRKSLSVHVDVSGAMSLAECVDERGGIEIGLALDKDQMSKFSTLFEQSLELI